MRCALLLLADLLVHGERLADLVADRVERREGGHRLLKDHADAVAADRLEILRARRELGEVATAGRAVVEEDLAAGDVRRARQDAHDRLRGDGFARPRFADQRDGASRPDAHRQAVDRLHPPGQRAELDRQVADGQKVAGRAGQAIQRVSCLYGAMEYRDHAMTARRRSLSSSSALSAFAVPQGRARAARSWRRRERSTRRSGRPASATASATPAARRAGESSAAGTTVSSPFDGENLGAKPLLRLALRLVGDDDGARAGRAGCPWWCCSRPARSTSAAVAKPRREIGAEALDDRVARRPSRASRSKSASGRFGPVRKRQTCAGERRQRARRQRRRRAAARRPRRRRPRRAPRPFPRSTVAGRVGSGDVAGVADEVGDLVRRGEGRAERDERRIAMHEHGVEEAADRFDDLRVAARSSSRRPGRRAPSRRRRGRASRWRGSLRAAGSARRRTAAGRRERARSGRHRDRCRR